MNQTNKKSKYLLKDNNSLINIVYSSYNFSHIVHELLTLINNYMCIFINNNINLPLSELNFDNFEIIEIYNSKKKQNLFIHNIHKFNLITFTLIDTHNNVIDLSSSYELQVLIPIMKSNLHIITSKCTKQSSKVMNLQDKPKLIMRNINNQNDKIKKNNYTSQNRFIPNIDSENSHDNCESNEIKINKSLNCLSSINDNIIETDKKIYPNVPRPMNSILYESKNNIMNNIINSDDVEVDPLILKKTIDDLEKLKQIENNKINKLKENNKLDMHNFEKFHNNLGDIKRELKKNIEKEQEKQNRFQANKNAYLKIKEDIISGKLTEDKISELFINEYPIYKFMDNKNLLDIDDDYITYLNIYNELYPQNLSESSKHEEYIPHNLHYLNEIEQNKYNHIKKSSIKNSDLISEFMNKNNKSAKRYPSLQQVLDGIDSDESSNNKSFSESLSNTSKSSDDEENNCIINWRYHR